MIYVYIIKSLSRNYIYIGITNSIERRFKEHNTGKNKTTKPYLPFKILLVENFATRADGRREKYLKSGVGRELIKSLPKKQ